MGLFSLFSNLNGEHPPDVTNVIQAQVDQTVQEITQKKVAGSNKG